ncbi:MAG: vWA domain-containing protein [Caldisericum sp.]|uniref:vWA domain-containing protein n=1 Tax=Caldisericum sp. TaxID=2499687 RepID=UPI003D0E8FE6
MISERKKLKHERVFNFFSLFVIILLLLPIICLTGCNKVVEKPITYTRQEEIGLYEKVGTPIDIFLLLDQSNSMSGYGNEPATDPKNIRVEASKYFITNLSRRSENEPYLRIGLINFGTDVNKENTVDLTEVKSDPEDTNTKKLVDSIKPLSLQSTSFIKALKVSYNQFEAYRTLELKRKPVIVIFTDGEPYDNRNLSLSNYFSEIDSFYRDYLQKIGCEIFMIGIDTTGKTWAKSVSYWEKIIGSDQIYRIESMDELFSKYNEIVQKLFYLPITSPDIFTKSLEFEVQPYLEKIQFDIYPETKEIAVEIVDSENKKISEANPDVTVKEYPTYKTVVVSNPPPGKWKYEIVKGQGTVKIYKTLIPNKMNLVSPSLEQVLGRSFKVIFAFLKSDDTAVQLLPEYPLVFSGKIVSPDGNTVNLKFKKGEKGIYFTEEYNPQSEGLYKIILIATGREGFEIKNEYNISVQKVPYISLNSPQDNSNLKGFRKELEIEVTLNYENKLIDPSKFFETDPSALIWAQIAYLPSGEKSKIVVPLQPSADTIGKFIGKIPINFNMKGQYILKVELDGKLKSTNNQFKDTLTSSFYLYPSILDYLKIYWYVILILILSIIAFWKRRLIFGGTLGGTLLVQGEEFPLSGHKMTIGGKGADIIIDDSKQGIFGYIVPRLSEVDPKGNLRTSIEIHYKSSSESKKFDIVDTLENNQTMTIFGKIIKYIRD